MLTNLRALYYEFAGDMHQEKNAWNDILAHGRGFVVEEALAAKLRWGDTDDIPPLDNRGLEAVIARAYIDAYYGKSDSAYTAYQRMRNEYHTWYVRYKLLQLLLLLRREQEAREACRMWLKNSLGVEHFGDWEKRSMEFIAGTRSATDFFAVNGDSVGRFFVNYQLAFLAYARGDCTDSLRRFQKCAAWGYADERRHWARAFASRLAADMPTRGDVATV